MDFVLLMIGFAMMGAISGVREQRQRYSSQTAFGLVENEDWDRQIQRGRQNGPSYDVDQEDEVDQSQQLDGTARNTKWQAADNLPQSASVHVVPEDGTPVEDEAALVNSLLEGGEVYHFGINPEGIRVIGVEKYCERILEALDVMATIRIQRGGLQLGTRVQNLRMHTLITRQLKLPGNTDWGVGGLAFVGTDEQGNLLPKGVIVSNPERSLGEIIVDIAHECDHLEGLNHDVILPRDRQLKEDLARLGIR